MSQTDHARPVCVAASGSEGQAVGDVISRLMPALSRPVVVALEPIAQLADFLAGASLGIRAAWRDVPAEFDAFGLAAAGAGVPWLPVAFGHPYIRVGPVIASGTAPCQACFLGRDRQHQAGPRSRQRADAYLRDAALGVRGYAAQTAALAAGQALALWAASGPRPLGAAAGEIRMIDCRSDEISSWHVTPAHGCRTCDPDPGALARAGRGRQRLREIAVNSPAGG